MEKLRSHDYLYLIQVILGFIWIKSAIPKVLTNNFVEALPKTLAYFASKNPVGWYKYFLETFAIPNATIFAELSRWGELYAGMVLFISALMLLKNPQKILHLITITGLLTGLFLNFNFGLASFWTSPANETVNLLMFLVQSIFTLFHFQKLRSRTHKF